MWEYEFEFFNKRQSRQLHRGVEDHYVARQSAPNHRAANKTTHKPL